ncbi:MAG: MFS transporter [Candidatus Latescibacteria bacterium]|jgi:MFS family permease|nr:MFS transporter [Candidatus Latescibacterota bacterium]MBT5832306.1 MFS transporter [Candidatus Latescibacterota bacterium]
MPQPLSTNHPKVGYFDLIRSNKNWRYLWLGQIVSLLGDWFNLIASASLIASLTDSGFAIGGLFVVRALAPFLVSPFAGVMADRYNRKNILIGCDIVRIFIVIGFLFIKDPQFAWVIYLLTALQLGVGGVFFTARRAITPDIVAPHEIGPANAIGSATWSVMLAIGAAIGGLVSGAFGVYTAFAIDSVTFIVSALFILRVKYQVPAEVTKARSVSIWRFHEQYLDGLRYLKRYPEILAITLHKAALQLTLSSGYEIAQVQIAKNIFPIGVAGAISLGLLYATSGVGSGLGPIIARSFTGDRISHLRKTITLGYFIAALGLVIISTLHSFPVVVIGGLLRSVGGGIAWVFSTQLLLLLVPTHVRGRVFSFEQASFALTSSIAAATSGLLLDAFPHLSQVILGMSFITLIPGIFWFIWCFKRPINDDFRAD